MKEFTISVDSLYDYYELFEYLFGLKGIKDVVITTDDLLTVYTKYDSNLISDQQIKLEILAFLNLLNFPSVYYFDRHFKGKADIYKIECDSICCDYCFGNAMEDLFDTDAVVKVESNFYDKFFARKDKFFTRKEENNKYYINIYYNPKAMALSEMRKLVNDLDICE